MYAGDSGVALLYLGLYRATKKKRWRTLARRALDRAFAQRDDLDSGLYTGRAGIGQVCLDAYQATGSAAFLTRAKACAEGLTYTATDIISGAAGIGVIATPGFDIRNLVADLAGEAQAHGTARQSADCVRNRLRRALLLRVRQDRPHQDARDSQPQCVSRTVTSVWPGATTTRRSTGSGFRSMR